MAEISVIIPCYNTKQELIISCVKSIINQTFNDFEIIIVDDGSRSEHREIYEDICGLDLRIKVVYQKNCGVSAARNRGVKESKGNYIVFIDSDDLIVPDFFENAYKVICRERADMVIGCETHQLDNMDLGDGKVFELDENGIKNLRIHMVGKRIRFDNDMIYIGRGPVARIVRRELAVNTLFNANLSICEDIVWNLQLLDKCKKVCCVRKAWYIYITNPESAVNRYDPLAVVKAENGLLAVRELLNFDFDEEYCAFGDRCLEDIIRIFKNAVKVDKEAFGEIKRKLYKGDLWKIIEEPRFWKLSDKKTRFKILLYEGRLLFFAIYVKNKLKCY